MATPEVKKVKLTFDNGKEVTASRFNTTHYTFWGKLSMYDHVYLDLEVSEADGTPLADEDCPEIPEIYIFAHEPMYPDLVELVRKNNFPQVLNVNEVSDGDKAAFNEQLALDCDIDLGGDFPAAS